MSAISSEPKEGAAGPAEPPQDFFDARAEFASRFLAGEGLEIGALHLPLAMPPQARPKYVDRMSADQLRSEYPELGGWDLTDPDLIDNGELLETVADGSQDFIVANHFLEHCEDPVRTIGTHLGKLRPGGVLFYAVPDKRYSFDHRREVTPLEHMVADHEQGPERSRREHYDQWARLVDTEDGPEAPEETQARARKLEEKLYSIHMHVWTQAEFLKMIIYCRERYEEAFDIEAAARQGLEFVVVLRKQGPPPEAAVPLPPPPPPSLATRVKRRIRRTIG
ncbi:MAG: methyltransferase domain-containing protein [Thermoleophilia bacterium]